MPTLTEMNRHYACFFSCGGPFQQPASVPFPKFDEDVLRTLRGLRLHPLPARSPPRRSRGALRRDWTTKTPTQPSVAERPSRARGSGVEVEDDHGRSACSHGAAVKQHVEITFRSWSTNL